MADEKTIYAGENRAELPRARARFIAQSIQLEESDAPGVVSVGIYATIVFMFGFVIWSMVTPVNEVAVSTGEVLPQGNNYVVQHFEGGIVEKLYVKNGAMVSKGETLMQIAPVATESDFEQLSSRQAALKMQAVRLDALLKKETPVFAELAEEYPRLAASEYSSYLAQMQSQQSQLDTAKVRVEQREQELIREQSKTKALKNELSVLDQQVKMREKLSKRGAVSKSELLEYQAERAETRTSYIQARANIEVNSRAVREAKQALTELEHRLHEQLRLENGKVEAELSELEQQLLKFDDRVSRLSIRAPAAGVVKGLEVNTIGSVIDAGQILMEIVPSNEKLVVQAKVSTDDVGHVHTGMEAVIKVGSYDPQLFGTVTGVVERISASTFFDEQNQPYYKAVISLEKDYLGSEERRHRIIPGMTVQADIRTGQKTVLDYLLKPVYRGFQNAFQER